MRLSTRSTYGMRALMELGLSRSRGPLSAAAIATRQHLSVAYLEQLLHRLKKHGLITSVRGPKGGYALARSADHISIGEIVRALDGTVPPKNGHDSDTPDYAQQIAHTVFRCVHERLANALNTITLQQLCDEVRSLAGDPIEHRYVFHI